MYVAIAPHADDEIVGFVSKLSEVKKIIFVCYRDDDWFSVAMKHCMARGIEVEIYDYRALSLINCIESERLALRERLKDSIWDNIALIPSYIDRNSDHTMLWMLLSPIVKPWSLFYSYTNTLPGLSESIVETAEEKDYYMKLYYPEERDILFKKGILFNFCYYEKVWSL